MLIPLLGFGGMVGKLDNCAWCAGGSKGFFFVCGGGKVA